MQILDGKALSNKIKENLKIENEKLKEKGLIPGLAVILVGEDPASQTYVNSKEKSCQAAGIYSKKITMDENISEKELLDTIKELNIDDKIHGILVQLPLPKHINSAKVLETIVPEKDVDGFHEYNVGKLVTGNETFVPCTPLGVMKMLEEYGINPTGMDACVIGRSNIVGKPMMNLLLNAGATITVCHSKTKNLKEKTLQADLLVVGIGKANMVTADMVKKGAIVIDVGINRLENGKLTGDVDFDSVASKCSYITPVPGGVGPMTIAMLLQNTVTSAKRFFETK
ncbi:bifunctional methylenetetrahydrofolate dehydrogenase/methenyltetrahydrofolate cyclohydrolase FolD [Sulfurospirillum arcachonense]|uniref:bifunctional methylenetetrahydrofolate dehydrogenase/methenyltetrahydrofolate cyclohydrolase FolD n=1 Tax=Sulfurospirillum arcachonense TaxID=57666 RepID=UPI000468DC8E|nr:bifunctional methylenetetrahydrofolate dehydrogenase/methenyltetrahydrofolate cyclohydrolase FolD [Sulfurospirillum arcachonense]